MSVLKRPNPEEYCWDGGIEEYQTDINEYIDELESQLVDAPKLYIGRSNSGKLFANINLKAYGQFEINSDLFPHLTSIDDSIQVALVQI